MVEIGLMGIGDVDEVWKRVEVVGVYEWKCCEVKSRKAKAL